MKWIKKQLTRAWNIIAETWIEMVFEFADDLDFTLFGRIISIILMSIITSIFTVLLIVFMPFILAMLKHDESLGF